MEETLEAVLSDEPPKEEVTEEVVTEEAETGEVDTEAKTEVETPEPEKVEESEAPPAEQKDNIPITALLDERDKRQKAERRLAELEAKQQEETPADPVADPDAFNAQVERTINKRVFEVRRELMADLHDDWSEAEAWLEEQLGSNAAIKAHLAASENVLKDGYQLFKQHKELQELRSTDFEALKDLAKQEALAELELERKAGEQKQEANKAGAEKPSLAQVGTSKGAATEGELSLEDLVGIDAVNRPA